MKKTNQRAMHRNEKKKKRKKNGIENSKSPRQSFVAVVLATYVVVLSTVVIVLFPNHRQLRVSVRHFVVLCHRMRENQILLLTTPERVTGLEKRQE